MHYSDESIQFIKADIAELSYADLIRMGVSSTPVVRLHTQVRVSEHHNLHRLVTYHGVASAPVYAGARHYISIEVVWPCVASQCLQMECRIRG